MIDKKKLKIAVEAFSKNPHWKKELDSAPTELSRKNTELDFYYSYYLGEMTPEEKKEIIEESNKLKQKFGLEDWKHSCLYCGNNPYRGVCRKKIRELGGKEGEKWLIEHYGH